MKREILRMNHIISLDDGVPVLDYLSMQVFEREIYGILSLEYHGIDKMVELICWNRQIRNGQVLFQERLVNSAGTSDNSRNRVALIGRQSRLVNDLSLADNMFVIRTGFKKFFINDGVIEAQAQQLLDELQIQLSPSTPVKELGNFERLVAELLCAIIAGDNLIILWQISDMLSSEELPRFHELIRTLTEKGKTFLYIYNHHEVLQQVCDRIAIFKGGCIEKVFLKSDEIQGYIVKSFASYAYEKLSLLKAEDNEETFCNLKPVLTLKHIHVGNIEDLSFSIRPGENVLLLDTSNTILDELMELFAGTLKPLYGKIEPGNIISGSRYSRRIAIIQRDPVSTMLFPQLSFLENLCFQLADKVPFFWQKPNLKKNIMKEYQEELGDLLEEPHLYHLNSKELYTLVYYRYLLAKPDLVVCLQPLSGADMYMRTHILGLMAKLRDNGIAVLVLNTELYDTLYLADRLIQVENGQLVAEYAKSHFEEVRMKNVIFPAGLNKK